MTKRLIASLAFAGLLAPCQAAPAPAVGPSTAPSVAASPTARPAGSWARVTDIPTGRSEVAAVVFEGRIVVIGGLGGPKAVERYDPRTRTWDRLVDLPFPVDHVMAAAIEEGTEAGIFVFGGYVNGVASKRTWYLPRDDDLWRELTSMPEARAAGAAVTVGTKIYVVGGASQAAPGVQALALPTFEFDLNGPLLRPWSVRAPIPTARDHLAAVLVGGKVCAVGGRQLSAARNLNAFECYDPATDSWETLPPLLTARGGFGAAVAKDRVVVVGGEEPAGTFKQTEVFDLKARTWSRGPDLPTPRHGLGVVAVDGIVYALAGGPTPGGSQTKICEALTLP